MEGSFRSKSSRPRFVTVRPLCDQERKFSVRMSGAGRKADVVRDATNRRLSPRPDSRPREAHVREPTTAEVRRLADVGPIMNLNRELGSTDSSTGSKWKFAPNASLGGNGPDGRRDHPEEVGSDLGS